MHRRTWLQTVLASLTSLPFLGGRRAVAGPVVEAGRLSRPTQSPGAVPVRSMPGISVTHDGSRVFVLKLDHWDQGWVDTTR